MVFITDTGEDPNMGYLFGIPYALGAWGCQCPEKNLRGCDEAAVTAWRAVAYRRWVPQAPEGFQKGGVIEDLLRDRSLMPRDDR